MLGVSGRGVVSDLGHIFASRPPANRWCTTGCSSCSRNVGSTAARGVRGTAGAPPPCLTRSPAWWAKTMVGRYTHWYQLEPFPVFMLEYEYVYLTLCSHQATIHSLLLWIPKCCSLYLSPDSLALISLFFSFFPTCKIPKPYQFEMEKNEGEEECVCLRNPCDF